MSVLFAQIFPHSRTSAKLGHNMETDEAPLLRDLAIETVGNNEAADPAAELARTQAYNRTYWQDYAKRHKRVFGTLSLAQYNQIKQTADQNHRTVWQQIWTESQAYRTKTTVPIQTLENGQQSLLIEIRRIGNNLNQLAKLGHIRANREGNLTAQGDDQIGVTVLRWCQALERQIKANL